MPRDQSTPPRRPSGRVDGTYWYDLSPGLAGLDCPACRTRLATGRIANSKIVYDDDDDDGHEYAETVVIGRRIALEPGFVNHKRLHANGMPWYRRSPDEPGRPSPTVRPPVVIRCRCGQDAEIEGATSSEQVYASGDPESRATEVLDELAESTRYDEADNQRHWWRGR